MVYLHSQQGAHGRHQQINCNDGGYILTMELEFQTLTNGQHDFHHSSIETTDVVAYWQSAIWATDANLISMPLIGSFVCVSYSKIQWQKKPILYRQITCYNCKSVMYFVSANFSNNNAQFSCEVSKNYY